MDLNPGFVACSNNKECCFFPLDGILIHRSAGITLLQLHVPISVVKLVL